jgi:hypothetical protein
MAQKFLMATLNDGTQVVSAFENLGGTGQGYATQVFARVKPFNAWKNVGNTHPHSGEPVKIRTRVMYSGAEIRSISQVKPIAGREESHGYEPENFEAVSEMQHGRYGMYVAPSENTPVGAVAGAEYPIHREEDSFRRFVILRVATADTVEVRHWLDAQPVEGAGTTGGVALDDVDAERRNTRTRGPGDADEDIDD